MPTGNIGIACGGVSGLLALDIDPAGRESLNGHSLAPTPTTITGRGHHLLYRHVATIRGTHGGVLPGVDTRGSGGYVIAPPSVHPSGAYLYGLAPGMSPDDLPLADPPPWLVDLLRQIERRREAPDPEGDDPILVALRDRGLLKSAKAGCPGVWHVTCPWTAEHTDGVDDGAAYFAPHFDGRDKPGFKRHHGHCDERTIRDLLRVLRHEAPTPEPSTSVREDSMAPRTVLRCRSQRATPSSCGTSYRGHGGCSGPARNGERTTPYALTTWYGSFAAAPARRTRARHPS